MSKDQKKLERGRIYYRACQLFVDLRIDNFSKEDIQAVGKLLSSFVEKGIALEGS